MPRNSYHNGREIITRFIDQDDEDEEARLHLGIEVETDIMSNSRAGERWSDSPKSETLYHKLWKSTWLPIFDPTNDGSLNHGIEFVSQPATIGWWQWMKPMLVEGAAAIVEAGLRSHNTDTCGLHVHASRSFFAYGPNGDAKSLTNLLILIEQNWFAMTQIARRGENRYAKRSLGSSMKSTKDSKFDKSMKETVKEYTYDDIVSVSDRYRAINYSGENTVEFRFFKGTLNPNTILATLQFINNLCHVARIIPTEVALEYTVHDIIGYRKYPELMNYVAGLELSSNSQAVYETSESSE